MQCAEGVELRQHGTYARSMIVRNVTLLERILIDLEQLNPRLGCGVRPQDRGPDADELPAVFDQSELLPLGRPHETEERFPAARENFE